MAEILPLQLSPQSALKVIREIATKTENIVVVSHARKRQKQRKISRRQIELCIQRGVIVEGPFMNAHGNWQLNLQRTAAGEEITCVVAIDWPNKLIVVTAF